MSFSGRVRMRRAVAVAGVAAVLAAAPAGTALAAGNDDGGSGGSPAIVGPMLDFFAFGSSVGVPTVCSLATGALGGGAAEYGFGDAISPLLLAMVNGCDTVSTQGSAYVLQGQQMSQPLVAWNPYLNPAIGQVAASTTQVGTDYGDALAPFGPTIAGLGGTIAWFEGS
jgi:hypothetical protein